MSNLIRIIEIEYSQMSKLKSYTSFKRTIRQFDPTLQRTTDVPILDSDGSGSIDSVYDPLSYVKNVTGTVLGIYPSYLPYNQERWQELMQ